MSEIGHNQGPPLLAHEAIRAGLATDHHPLTTRAIALGGSAKRFHEKYPDIPDAEVQATGTEVLNQCFKHVRLIEELRKKAKDPYLSGGRAVDTWFNTLRADLETAFQPVRQAMLQWASKQEKAEREAALRRAEEAAHQASLLERLADQGSHTVSHDDAAVAAAEAETARREAEVKPADFTRVHGDYGSVSSLRRTWRPSITTPELVPMAYCSPDLDKIKLAQKRAEKGPDGKPTLVIPGVEWLAVEQLTTR
jgi:hypothetical protein